MTSDFIIREVSEADANRVVELLNRIDNQTDFMKFEPGERPTDAKRIKEIVNTAHDTIILAEAEKELIGYLLFFGNPFNKKKHKAEIILAVDKNHQGKGVGTQLIKNAQLWARNHGVEKLELTAATDNEKAYRLYNKLGFTNVGTRQKASKIGDKYRDDYLMEKFL